MLITFSSVYCVVWLLWHNLLYTASNIVSGVAIGWLLRFVTGTLTPTGGAEFARNWIYKERGWKLQGKEYSRKAPKIRIRVNLQGMDLSRKSRSGIRKEQYFQGKEFARNGTRKERGWNLQGMGFARYVDCCVYHSSVGGRIWPAMPVYVTWECESC